MAKLTLLKTARILAKEHNYDGPLLREAIPYLKSFFGKAMVLKVGGSVLNSITQDNGKLSELVSDIIFLKKVGINVILVHGGSRQLDAAMQSANIEPKKIKGLRVTTPEVLEMANAVFLQISNTIKSEIKSLGFKALIFDKDTGLVKSIQNNSELECVGTPVSVNTDLITSLAEDIIPIIPAITVSDDNISNAYNVNADDVASIIAKTLQVEKLVLMTDVAGVNDAEGKLISSLTKEDVAQLIKDGTIAGGMLPKVNACLNALDGGVHKAHIILGNSTNQFMDEILTDTGAGTEFVNLTKNTSAPSCLY